MFYFMGVHRVSTDFYFLRYSLHRKLSLWWLLDLLERHCGYVFVATIVVVLVILEVVKLIVGA